MSPNAQVPASIAEGRTDNPPARSRLQMPSAKLILFGEQLTAYLHQLLFSALADRRHAADQAFRKPPIPLRRWQAGQTICCQQE